MNPIQTKNHKLGRRKFFYVFYNALISLGQIRTSDAKGLGPIDPSLLPGNLMDLPNDFFRSLAAYAHVYKCWKGVDDIPFVEFLWADFFREQLSDRLALLRPQVPGVNLDSWCAVRPSSPTCLGDENEALHALLPQAVRLCEAAEAAHLPGWYKREKPPPMALASGTENLPNRGAGQLERV